LQYDTITNQLLNDQGKLILGSRNYELTNHLGNVLVVISDKKILLDSLFQADVISANDYYPFGMTIESRTFQTEQYRFSFNGQERDTEININIHHAEFWKYDSRLARRWNTDPVFVPFESPYATFRNNPIIFIDPAGNVAINTNVDTNQDSENCQGCMNYITQIQPGLALGKIEPKKDHIEWINNVLRHLDSGMDNMFDKTFTEGIYTGNIEAYKGKKVTYFQEYGAFIKFQKKKFSFQNETNGKPGTRVYDESTGMEFTEGYGTSVEPDYKGISKHSENTVYGFFHTHPSTHPFSNTDIKTFIYMLTRFRIKPRINEPFVFLVETTNRRYAIVVHNYKKVYKNIYKLGSLAAYKEIIDKNFFDNTNGEWNNYQAVLNAVGKSEETGIEYYETSKNDKTNFIKRN